MSGGKNIWDLTLEFITKPLELSVLEVFDNVTGTGYKKDIRTLKLRQNE